MQQVVKAVDEQGQRGWKEHLALTVTLYRPSSSCPQNCTAVYGNLKASIGGGEIPFPYVPVAHDFSRMLSYNVRPSEYYRTDNMKLTWLLHEDYMITEA